MIRMDRKGNKKFTTGSGWMEQHVSPHTAKCVHLSNYTPFRDVHLLSKLTELHLTNKGANVEICACTCVHKKSRVNYY